MKLHATSCGIAAPHHPASEDVFSISPCADGGLLCVLSDGVGAARDPRRCAERVVRLVSDNFSARPRHWSPRRAFERLIDEANSSLYREGAYLDGVPSMQATLAAVCLSENRLSGINIGDSPVLLIRNGTAERLTETHSIRKGDGGDMLTNAMGMGNAVIPHYFERELTEGDIVVITSDGLTHLLGDEEIGDYVRRFGTAKALVHEASKTSSNPEDLDDLSAIVVEVKEISPPAESAALIGQPLPLLKKGRQIDDFQLLRPMAGNNRVWLAEKGGTRFVLKFIPTEVEGDDSGIVQLRFAREAWNACRIKNSFFVEASLPESGSPYYYVMEYIEAPSLSFLLKSRRLAVDEAIELGKFLARACQWLLRHELIHGDIKSENILTFRTGDGVDYKLLDLGLASPIFTDSGVAGTPSYLAPERFNGAVITERTEIFAIGVTLYEMITGRLPFGAIERFQKPHFHPARRPSHWNPNIPPWLDAVVMKCLSLRDEKRFQHYSELLFALEHPASAPTDAFDSEPLLTRNPLLFYKAGFWLLLVLSLFLIIKLIATL